MADKDPFPGTTLPELIEGIESQVSARETKMFDQILASLALRGKAVAALRGIVDWVGTNCSHLELEPVHQQMIRSCLDAGVDIDQFFDTQGADPDIPKSGGDECTNALTLACTYEHLPLVQFLIECGASLDPKFPPGSSQRGPLLTSIYYSDEVAQALIEAGADISMRDKDGDTPLHEACRWGRHDIYELLLSRGADAFARNNEDENMLHVALKNEEHLSHSGLVVLCRRFAELGINPHDRSEDGQSAMDLGTHLDTNITQAMSHGYGAYMAKIQADSISTNTPEVGLSRPGARI